MTGSEMDVDVEHLRRWKEEATEVLTGMQTLGKALGLPLGTRITGTLAAETAERLKAERDEAHAAIARVVALRDAEMIGVIESRVRAARADVRCLDCNLRYEERQEYGCHESGRGHSYAEGDLAAAEQIERSGSVEYVTLAVADLSAALAELERDEEGGRCAELTCPQHGPANRRLEADR